MFEEERKKGTEKKREKDNGARDRQEIDKKELEIDRQRDREVGERGNELC